MIKNISILFIGLIVISGCSARKDYPGVEYAPQMYHSVPYEPLTQITEDGYPSGLFEDFYYKVQFKGQTNSLDFNDLEGKADINSKKSVSGTVKRQETTLKTDPTGLDQDLIDFDYHKDSLEFAAREKNPLRLSPEYDSAFLVDQGKELYIGACSPCHGEKGQGNGKVGEVYKGVPSYSQGRYATMSEGHIYHVITHGKGRMWPHKSQVSPKDRWKIVMYVQTLQTSK